LPDQLRRHHHREPAPTSEPSEPRSIDPPDAHIVRLLRLQSFHAILDLPLLLRPKQPVQGADPVTRDQLRWAIRGAAQAPAEE